MKVAKKVFESAKKNYSNLLYHNYDHAFDVYRTSRMLVKRIKKKIDEQALYHACLFHDAGYHLNHKKLGFKKKEYLSAEIARKELIKLGYSKQHADKVVKIILATIHEAKPKTIEEKIIRASDLSGMKAAYKKFLNTNNKVRREFEKSRKKKFSDKEWKKITKEKIGYYLSENIKLSKKYYNRQGKSLWHTRVKRNLDRYLSD